jgi:hypothetical protein
MIALRTLREAVFVAAPRGSGGAVRKQRRRDHPSSRHRPASLVRRAGSSTP